MKAVLRNLSPKRLRAAGTGGAWFVLAGTLLLAAWTAGLFWFFPTAALETRIEQDVTARLDGAGRFELEELSLNFPFGLAAAKATLSLQQPSATEIAVNELRLTPLWLSLLSGNPGLTFAGELLGGEARGFVRRHGELQLGLKNLRFTAPLVKNSSLAVTGTIEQGELSAQWPPPKTSASKLELRIGDIQITGLDAIGAAGKELNIGTLVVQGSGTGNAFTVNKIESSGGQLLVTGNGSILLANPIDRSRINLTGKLQPTPQLDPQLRELLGLVSKEVAGSYPFTISGTLSRPQAK